MGASIKDNNKFNHPTINKGLIDFITSEEINDRIPEMKIDSGTTTLIPTEESWINGNDRIGQVY